jgi:hypothetical protein
MQSELLLPPPPSLGKHTCKPFIVYADTDVTVELLRKRKRRPPDPHFPLVI